MPTADRELAELLGPWWVNRQSDDYDARRRVFNGAIDRHPYGIARCRSMTDVRRVLEVVRRHGLTATVRGSGHNVAGRAVADGSVLLDLRAIRHVSVDPAGRRAVAGAGATWAELDRATQRFGLATPGGTVSSTGITGLTLGGGVGWLLPSFGLSCDSLEGVTVLTTDGDVLRVTDETPELMSVLRGGGPGLGVVAELVYRLHAVTSLTGGAVIYPLDDAADVLRRLGEVLPGLPTAVMISPALRWHDGTPLLELDVAINGELADWPWLASLIRVKPPLESTLQRRSYVDMQRFLDNPARQYMPTYWKSGFIPRIGDREAEILIESIRAAPTQTSMLMLEHYHGAYQRTPAGGSVFPHRGRSLNALAVANWTNPQDGRTADRCKRWARATIASLLGHGAAPEYINYVSDDSGPVAIGDSVARARARLDPGQVLVFQRPTEQLPALGSP